MIMGFTEAARMFRDAWNLYKKYAARKVDKAELEEFTCKVGAVYEKYKTPFAKEIILAVVGEIERAAKFYDRRRKGE